MEITISRFEPYPAEEPTGYAVGLTISTENGRGFYRDTVVSLKDAEGKTDEEIAKLAYIQMQEGIEPEAQRLESKSSIIGTKLDTTSIPPLKDASK